MKTIILALTLISGVLAAQPKEDKPKSDKQESVTLSSFHVEQLKAFDQQQKDIQTAAAVLENDRKLFVNTLLGREVNHSIDSVFYDPSSTSIKVYKRKVPLQQQNR